MQVPLIDLQSQYRSVKEEILDITERIFDSQNLILGPFVDTFEKEAAAYCKTKYALGVSSGTDALLIAMMAAGLCPNDRVITTSYTFFATGGCITRVGGIPMFTDIDPDTYNIDPKSVEAEIDKLTDEERKTVRAIIPVHLYGQCVDMDPIMKIAEKYDLTVIEDACQSIGATYKDRRAGGIGDYGCFSFYPTKNLGAFGDAGMVVTQSDEIYDKLKLLRIHGAPSGYCHRIIGGNFRMDGIQGGILSVKLKHLDDWTNKRIQNAVLYKNLLQEKGLTEFLVLPHESGERHIFNQFVIKIANDKPGIRDMLKDHLAQAGISSAVYYPKPLHMQECFGYLKYREGDFPVSEDAAKKTLALPIYPELSDEQIGYVVDAIEGFFKK